MRRFPPRPPHSDSPELPPCPTCDLETPDTYAQAHAEPHSKISRATEDKEFAGLRAVGTFQKLGGGIATRDQHCLGQVGVFLEECRVCQCSAGQS